MLIFFTYFQFTREPFSYDTLFEWKLWSQHQKRIYCILIVHEDILLEWHLDTLLHYVGAKRSNFIFNVHLYKAHQRLAQVSLAQVSWWGASCHKFSAQVSLADAIVPFRRYLQCWAFESPTHFHQVQLLSTDHFNTHKSPTCTWNKQIS